MLIVMPNSIGNFTKLFDDEETPMKNKFHTIINDVWSGRQRLINLYAKLYLPGLEDERALEGYD